MIPWSMHYLIVATLGSQTMGRMGDYSTKAIQESNGNISLDSVNIYHLFMAMLPETLLPRPLPAR